LKINIRHITGLYGTNICRFLLAAVFIFSGFVKAIDPLGSLYKMQDYLTAFGMGQFFPSWLILIAGILLSAVEFTLGVYLLLGIRRNFTSITTLAFMSVMTLLTLYLAIANPIHDCGCFGDALVLTNTDTFLKNIVLLAAAFLVFKQRVLVVRLISLHTAWIASTYTWIFVFALSLYCLRKLPILDFRPYKIGNELKASMDNFDPVFQDFYLTDVRNGEELADSILTSKGYTFLLVARQLEKADDSNIDLINELYDYCTVNGYGFYAMTASNDEQIQEWRERTGAEYPFCRADDITMKTMIRSNPGVMLLKGDTIVNKWSNNRLPDEYVLNGRLEQIPVGSITKESDTRTLSITLLWFLVPLFAVIGLDRMIPLLNKNKTKEK
jgi:uncharacterized membrane protein YphA (DoxX/SURF4 family)